MAGPGCSGASLPIGVGVFSFVLVLSAYRLVHAARVESMFAGGLVPFSVCIGSSCRGIVF